VGGSPQSSNSVPVSTRSSAGERNAVLNAGLYGLPPSMTKDRLPAIQAFADIGEFFDEPVKTYSSGMVVRLAFAVIAHVDAEILIIDEALAVGDAFFTQKCMRFLREFKQRGTIFFVSHDTQAIQSLCDRAALITGGQLTCIGDARMVTETYLENLYANQQVVALPNRTTKHESESDEPAIDYRQAVLEESDLRNDIRVFEFDLTSPDSARVERTSRGVAERPDRRASESGARRRSREHRSRDRRTVQDSSGRLWVST